MPKQTILEALLIMAYNVGREHERTHSFSIENGRAAMVKALGGLVEDVDPGDLARAADSFIEAKNDSH